jgi:GNAT superfamily N-acetyltransferase
VSLDFLPEIGTLVLYELFVPKAHRRRGLGTALVAIVEQMALGQGFERVTLTPHAFERNWSVSALKAWYRRPGYAERPDVPSEFEKAVGPDAA